MHSFFPPAPKEINHASNLLAQVDEQRMPRAFINELNYLLKPLAVTVSDECVIDPENDTVTLEARLGDHGRVAAFRVWRGLHVTNDIIPPYHPQRLRTHTATVRVHDKNVHTNGNVPIMGLTDKSGRPVISQLSARSPIVVPFDACRVTMRTENIILDPKESRATLCVLFRALLGGSLANDDAQDGSYAVAYPGETLGEVDVEAKNLLQRIIRCDRSASIPMMVPEGVDGALAVCTYKTLDEDEKESIAFPEWFGPLRTLADDYLSPEIDTPAPSEPYTFGGQPLTTSVVTHPRGETVFGYGTLNIVG